MCLPCTRSHEDIECLCAELHAEGICTLVKEHEKVCQKERHSSFTYHLNLTAEHVTDYFPPGWSHFGVYFILFYFAMEETLKMEGRVWYCLGCVASDLS